MFDLDGGGTLDAAEFKTALPLMGENVPQAEIDELYSMADTDGSGEIDYEEFCFLVKKMNPEEKALSGEEPEEEGAGFLSDLGQFRKAVSILDTKTKVTLGPLALRKAGAIVENMQNAGYSDEKINVVCRGLFCLDEESLQGAWL